jgi:uncharacterized protein YdeI (YjbR/CyaY-like superfamily)
VVLWGEAGGHRGKSREDGLRSRSGGTKARHPARLEGGARKRQRRDTAFRSLAPCRRKVCPAWIESAKKPDTRKRRIDKTLATVMPGEKRKG